MKITNIWKHLGGGVALCLFYVLAQLIGPISAIIVSVVAWEIMQMVICVLKETKGHRTLKVLLYHAKVYLEYKWLDCLVDMFMGVLGFTVICIIVGILGILESITVVW